MNKQEFMRSINLIKNAYNIEFTKEQLIDWFELLKDQDNEVLFEALKELVKTNKFIPSIAEIIGKCNDIQHNKYLNNLEEYKTKGIIKTQEEYDKLINWSDKGIHPSWLNKEIKKEEISAEELEELENEFKQFK